MGFFQYGDLHLFYERAPGPPEGGPPVVFLHGLGSSAADWSLQTPVFSQTYPVITVDLRGHGQTRGGSRPLTVEQMADDVAALLDHLDEPAVHAVGLSLGGCVAQALALRHPARARSLALVNTFARYRPAGLSGRLHVLIRWGLFLFLPMPATAAYVARGLFPRPEQRPYYDAAVARLSLNSKPAYRAAARAALAFDSRAQLPAVRCPALVVVGDRDRTVPLASDEALHRSIPGAELAIIRDSGHATPYDQTEQFNRVVLDFLARH